MSEQESTPAAMSASWHAPLFEGRQGSAARQAQEATPLQPAGRSRQNGGFGGHPETQAKADGVQSPSNWGPRTVPGGQIWPPSGASR